MIRISPRIKNRSVHWLIPLEEQAYGQKEPQSRQQHGQGNPQEQDEIVEPAPEAALPEQVGKIPKKPDGVQGVQAGSGKLETQEEEPPSQCQEGDESDRGLPFP